MKFKFQIASLFLLASFLVFQITLLMAAPSAEDRSFLQGSDQGELLEASEAGDLPESKEEDASPPKLRFPGFILANTTPVLGGILEAFAPASGKSLELILLGSEGEILRMEGLLSEVDGIEAFYYFVGGISSTMDPGIYALYLQEKTTENLLSEYSIEIYDREFISETIYLTPRLTAVRSDSSDNRYQEEAELQTLLLSRNIESDYIRTSSERNYPIEQIYYTSYFGDRRIFSYSDGSSARSIHNGLDFRAAVGDAVYVPLAAKVVMTASRIVTGKTVVLEHLPSIYSIYYHLDSIAVSEGDLVLPGELLGTAGNTGLSTGSHLHWEVRIAGEAVDPEIFLHANLLDRERVLAILSNDNVINSEIP